MVMNKTELQKLKVKMVLEMLVEEYNTEIEDNGDGGRMDVLVDGFTGQFSRRDMEIGLWDTIALRGDGFSKYEHAKRERAVELETAINDNIKCLIEQLDAQFA
jgi:hypothetical protein